MPLDNFANLISRLQAFDFGQEMLAAVSDNAEELPPMVRDQLSAGKDGDDIPNTIFGRSGYAPKTVEIKNANGVGLGAVTDRITNYMSGDFYESLVMDVENDVLEMDSDVSYFGDIRLYSDDSFLDVNEEHRKEFAEEYTMPTVEAALFQKTGLVVTHV